VKGRTVFLIIFILVLADQALKIFIKTHYHAGEWHPMAGNWFRLYFIENEGMAYGWKFGGDWGKMLLTLFRLVAVTFGVYYLTVIVKRKYHPGFIVCAALIFAGALGNLPWGEVFVAPLEASAEGRLVVDLTVGNIRPAEPISLTFRQGRVVEVTGGPEAGELRQRLGTDPWSWTVGEFGIGANPRARICGKVTVDEKVWGTVHVALGSNLSFGGCNPAATHYDCVVSAPQLWLDGAQLHLEAANGPSLP
jgi:hypothetical protein